MKDEQTRTRFETLLLPLMKDAYNPARWLMKSQEDAEDVVQESYLRAFRFFASFQEGTNCRAWFLRIVRNTCYTALGTRDLKQKQVPLDSETDEIEDTSPLPPFSLAKKAAVEAVREAIAALPVDFREGVVLPELVYRLLNPLSFVAFKMGRLRGGPSRTGAKGAYLNRYVTDEQRSSRPIFNATLRAAASWLFFRVARSTVMIQIAALRSRLEKQPTDLRRSSRDLGDGTLEGLSYKEISGVTGVPLGTVMSRLARARHQLYLRLSDQKQHDQL